MQLLFMKLMLPFPFHLNVTYTCNLFLSVIELAAIRILAYNSFVSLKLRYGIRQDRSGFKVLVWHFIGELTAVFSYTM